MSEILFIQIIEISLVATSVIGVLLVVTASIYDLRMIHTRRRLQSALSRMTHRRQIPVSVLIYTQNNADTLTACLDSVHASHYDNYKIIVANNASTDELKTLLSRYKRIHPTLPLTSYHTRVAVHRSAILRKAASKDTSGQLILLLDATDTITPTLLRDCASRFATNDTLDTLRLRAVPTKEISISSLSSYFYLLSKNTLYKSFAKTFIRLLHSDRSGIIMRRPVFIKEVLFRKLHADYASTATYTPAQQSTLKLSHQAHTRWLRIIYLTSAIIGQCILLGAMTYFLYTAGTLRSNILLSLSWAIVCFWLLSTIWSDEIYKLSTKIKLTFTVPFMYFILYVQMIKTLLSFIYQLISSTPTPIAVYANMRKALIVELYSSRY